LDESVASALNFRLDVRRPYVEPDNRRSLRGAVDSSRRRESDHACRPHPTWLRAAKALYANRTVTVIACYVLAALVFYGLLASGLTIVQILAVSLFVALLLLPGFAPYMGEVLHALEGKTFGQIMREQWLYTLIWTMLLAWGAWALCQPLGGLIVLS
jgi:hypothetical protein